MSDLLFGKNHAGWAAQSGLTPANSFSIQDHAHAALDTLTGLDLNVQDMLYSYLENTKLLTGALDDKVKAWDGTF